MISDNPRKLMWLEDGPLLPPYKRIGNIKFYADGDLGSTIGVREHAMGR